MSPASLNTRILLLAFVAAAVAVAFPMQFIVMLLGRPAYSMAPTEPLGVPQLFSGMFFGGLWGIVFALIARRFATHRLRFGLDWLLMGTILATGVLWFIVFPLKGRPVGNGFAMPGLVIGPLLHAAWAWAAWLYFGLMAKMAGDDSRPIPGS